MTKRSKIDLAIASVLICGVLLYVIFSPGPEPSYQGKSLSEWVIQYGGINNDPRRNPHAEAAEAIRNIGTRAVPYLLKWMRNMPPSWENGTHTTGETGGMRDPSEINRAYRLGLTAPGVFRVFGSKAKGAIPELAKLLNQSDKEKPDAAARALVSIGRESLPSLVSTLTNQKSPGHIHVASWIGYMGPDAAPAVPALLDLLKDPSIEMGACASNSLQKIAPEALKRATQP